MFTLREVRQWIEDYSNYIHKDGKPYGLVLPNSREHHPGYIHASSLGFCSNYAIRENRGDDYVFPHLAGEHMFSARMRMLEGKRMAQIVQEAIAWYFQDDLTVTATPEFYLRSHKWRLQGNMDMYVQLNPVESVIFEIKHRAYGYKTKPGPKMSDLLQLLAYFYIVDDGPMKRKIQAILTILATPNYREYENERAALRLYEIKYNLRTTHWYLVDEDGEVPTDNGVPIGISDIAFRDLIEEATMPDYLDAFTSWQCGYIERHDDGKKEGRYRVRCPRWCHSAMPKEGEVTIAFHSDANGDKTFVGEEW